jgi:hypothetical protein
LHIIGAIFTLTLNLPLSRGTEAEMVRLSLSVMIVILSVTQSFAADSKKSEQGKRKVAADACGNVDIALQTMRNLARKGGKISEKDATQVLSVLISQKLGDPALNEQDRGSLQQEHEGACGSL